MRNLTVKEVMNQVLLALNEAPITTFTPSTDIRQNQLLSCLNFARQYINTQGSFPWDEYFGTFITIGNKLSYQVTPKVYNYCANNRASTAITAANCTLSPNNDASFDDTYSLVKCTATSGAPSITMTTSAAGTDPDGTTQPALTPGRASASIWIKADGTNTPTSITMTFSDSIGGQVQPALSIPVTSNLTRVGVSGYFTSAQPLLKMVLTWTPNTSVVYVDGWQIENNDWPSEEIINTNMASPIIRQVYADPTRLLSIVPYVYNTRLSWNQVLYNDSTFYPADHTALLNTAYRFMSTRGNLLNVVNVPSATTLIYRAKRKPQLYTQATDIVDIPAPDLWTFIEGCVAYQKAFIYDIGTNTEAGSAQAAFANRVQDMIMTVSESPHWSFADTVIPVMMR